MSAEDFYDKNLFYEKQLLHAAKNNADRSYTHWTLYACTEDGGSTVPIISGIVTDPMVSFSIQHNFQSPDGIIGAGMAAVRGAFDTVDSISQSAAGLTSAMGTVLEAAIGEDNATGGLAEANAKLDNLIAGHEGLQKFKSTLSNYPGTKLVSTLDYTRVFKGTMVSAGIPTLQTRLYHGIPMTRAKADANHLSIQSQVAYLLKYLMGDDLSPTEGESSVGGKLNNIVGLQSAPNGYVPSFEGLAKEDKAKNGIKGTFVLRYGDVRIKNLLVTGLQINLSTLVTPRNEDTDAEDNDSRKGGRYLYADVVIQVEPCTYIGKTALLDMMNMTDYAPHADNRNAAKTDKPYQFDKVEIKGDVTTPQTSQIPLTIKSALESKGKSIKDIKQKQVLDSMKTDYPEITNLVNKIEFNNMTALEKIEYMKKGIG